MPTSPHLAVMIGLRARALRDVLPQVSPTLRCRVIADLYALAEDELLHESDSWWIDGDELGVREMGVLTFLRRVRPDAIRVVLADESADASEDDRPNLAEAVLKEAQSLGAVIVRGAPPLSVLRALLRGEDASVAPEDDTVLAGIADQLANPLAALAARLQLCEIALQSSAPVDFEDNLALARQTTDRIGKSLEKLRLLTAHGHGTRGPQSIYRVVRGVLQGEAFDRASADAVHLPAEDAEDPEVWVDLSFLEQALGGVLRTSLDLSKAGIAIAAYAAEHRTLLEIRLEEPQNMPRNCPDLFAPFGLNNLLHDPDLGLDLALARALIRSSGGRLHPLAHSGFLEGFQIELPRRDPDGILQPD